MSERLKIVLMYVGVAIIGVAVISTSMWIRNARKAQAEQRSQLFVDVGREEATVFHTLQSDLVATNQDGKQVRLSDLSDKVWVATQFFANCPKCLTTASDDLRRLYSEFGDNPDFHMVSITVNPEGDTVENLREYAEAVGADSDNWWFLTGDRQELWDYMEHEMKFMRVVEHEDAHASARFSHDLGTEIYRPGLEMVKKRDLFYARTQGEAQHRAWFEEVRTTIQQALADKKAIPVEELSARIP